MKLTVPLGERAYDIWIGTGLLSRAGELIAPHLKRKRVFVVTDQNVEAQHAATLEDSLSMRGIEVASLIVLAPGESTKNFDQVGSLLSVCLGAGLERSDVLIALGGGVIGDITGFAAAIALRGVNFIQIPTTLLAQVDSSVGGKTGIDTTYGKNTIGAFHQPKLVLIDTDVLKTLPKRELLAGYAEVVKYGLIKDAKFFDWLEKNGPSLLQGDDAARVYAIERSCAIKAEVAGADEREEGERALLNLGHTFGHALESETGFSNELVHGEAVSIGMMMAAKFSAELGLMPQLEVARIEHHLKETGLPARLTDRGINRKFGPETILAHMRHDKKVRGGKITLILLKAIGEAFIARDIDDARLLAFLHTELK
ncbi:MAG: 3-dehydroquinate synthase [Alphaproteobacteria bacterium]